MRAPVGKRLKLGVRLEFFGELDCPGLRKGGTLKKFAKFVTYNCRPEELPAKIVVDLTVLDIGEKVLIRDLDIDKDLLDSDEYMPVCKIVKGSGKRFSGWSEYAKRKYGKDKPRKTTANASQRATEILKTRAVSLK
eukprot:c20892_g1_i1 orf=232-639(-)